MRLPEDSTAVVVSPTRAVFKAESCPWYRGSIAPNFVVSIVKHAGILLQSLTVPVRRDDSLLVSGMSAWIWAKCSSGLVIDADW